MDDADEEPTPTSSPVEHEEPRPAEVAASQAAAHPLRIAARALSGALGTELAVAVAALVVVGTWSTLAWGGVLPALAHAAGLGLGAAVAVAVAEHLLCADRPLRALVGGVALSPLAALGSWYALELLDKGSVLEATQAVVAQLGDCIWGGSLLLLGGALVGYGPVLRWRRRGLGVLEQVVRSAWLLVVVGLVATLAAPEVVDAWPAGGWVALLLARAVALPVGLAVGDAAGATVVRALRGEGRSAPRTWAGSRSTRRAALLLLCLAPTLWLLALRDPSGPAAARLSLVWLDDDARLRSAQSLVSEDVRQVSAGWYGLRTASSPWAFMGRVERALLVGQGDAALSVAGHDSIAVGLHRTVEAALAPLVAKDDVDAMLLTAGVLQAGTRLRSRRFDDWTWWEYEPTDDERARARALARRVVVVGGSAGERPRRLVEGEALSRLNPGGLVRLLEEGSVDEALALARILAARDPTSAGPLNELLSRHRRLRTPADDAHLARGLSWTQRIPRERLVGLSPVLPAAPDEGASAPADALVRRALERWVSDPGAGRALALEALSHDERHADACALIGVWHLGRALADGGGPGHLEVAEQHLRVAEEARVLDPVLLVNGALCDAVRAMLAPGGDGGWATRALQRLHVVAALAPALEGGRLTRVEEALRGAGIRITLTRTSALSLQVTAHRKAAVAARSRRSTREATAHDQAAERLAALVASGGGEGQ